MSDSTTPPIGGEDAAGHADGGQDRQRQSANGHVAAHQNSSTRPLRPIPPGGGTCTRCGLQTLTYKWREFDDFTWHIDVRCTACGKFIGWAPKTASNIALADWVQAKLDGAAGR